MKTSAMLLIIGALWLTTVAGCRDEANEAEREKNITYQAATGGELHISEDGQAAIGLLQASAVRREVQVSISATGWLVARPASEVVVKAPATGFITPSITQNASLGKSVTKDERLGELQVFLSPQEQAQLVAAKVEADTQIEQSQATLELVEEQLKRVEETGPTTVAGTRLLELREVVARARIAEQEARQKLPFLPEEPYGEEPRLKTVPINIPLSGRLADIHFTPRQLVVQGDPLWTIVDWSKLWIRVPVYAADLLRVTPGEPVDVVVPGGKEVHEAQPVDIAQATDPGKQTVDLLYEIENTNGELRPGQAVSVSLPSGKLSSQIVIPRTAVIWDGMGNSWVYLKSSPTGFRRSKIELGQIVGNDVVVQRGLNEGDAVVTGGAEAMYGEEFKGQIQVEDDE